jgi:hypothetical protein
VVEQRQEEAAIFPNYQGTLTIPNNIAPLNFEILEDAKYFVVQIIANGTVQFQQKIKNQKLSIVNCQLSIPIKSWQKILNSHTTDTLEIHISSGNSLKKMTAYKPFYWIVSEDAIDPYLVFRRIAPTETPEKPQLIGIFEYGLETFEQRTLINSYLTDYGCMNCHYFSNNQSSRMSIHFRRKHAGTLITSPDSSFMVDLRLPNGEKGIFGAFSPNGRYLAFSTNQLGALFTVNVQRLKMWSYELASNMFVYDVQNNAILSSDGLMASGRQKTYPCWSHDGTFLYFCQTNWQIPFLTDSSTVFERLRNTHYELVRAKINVPSETFETVETIVATADIGGRSISFPRCSPDGRFVAFSTTEFGTLDPNSIDGRLWFYDLNTKTAKEIEPDLDAPIVSTSTWSSNSRWIVVSSRRLDGVFSRPFLAHVDTEGNVSKFFVMPQKNPAHYRKQDFSYSLPELITSPVPLNAYDIADAIRKPVKRPTYVYPFDTLSPATIAGQTHHTE